jgi:hypothetical protein
VRRWHRAWREGGAEALRSRGPVSRGPQSLQSRRRAADWYSRRSRSAASDQREPRYSRGVIWAAITRQGIVWPRRSSPVRGMPQTAAAARPASHTPAGGG